jgi:hypothetical protein
MPDPHPTDSELLELLLSYAHCMQPDMGSNHRWSIRLPICARGSSARDALVKLWWLENGGENA